MRSQRTRLRALPLVLGLLSAGCGGSDGGGGGVLVNTAPIPGGFQGAASNATLNGTFAYTFLGVDDDAPCASPPLLGGFTYDQFGELTLDGNTPGQVTRAAQENSGCGPSIGPAGGAPAPYAVTADGIVTGFGATGRIQSIAGNLVVAASTDPNEYGLGVLVQSAAAGFTLQSIQGTYSFALLAAEQATQRLEVLFGSVTFDGVGGATVALANAFTNQPPANGPTGAGTYTITANGTVTITIPGIGTAMGRVAAGNGYIVFADQMVAGETLIALAIPNATPAGQPSPVPPTGGTFAYALLRLHPGSGERRSEIGTMTFSADPFSTIMRLDYTSNSNTQGQDVPGTEFGFFTPAAGGTFQLGRFQAAVPQAPLPTDDLFCWISTDGNTIVGIENQSKTGAFSIFAGARY